MTTDYAKAYYKWYQQDNKEDLREYHKVYYESNKENWKRYEKTRKSKRTGDLKIKLLLNEKKYRDNYKERKKIINQRYYAKKKAKS